MRRIFMLLAVFVVLAAFPMLQASPASALGSTCIVAKWTIQSLVSYDTQVEIQVFDAGSSPSLVLDEFAIVHGMETHTFTSRFNVTSLANAAPAAVYNSSLDNILDIGITACGSDASGTGFGKIGDGRINDGPNELAAPLAAYCTADSGIAMWDIDSEGHGTLVFTASAADIAAGLSQAVASGARVQIAKGGGDSIWALPSNEIALVGPDLRESGKTYVYVAPGDRCA